MSTIEDILPIGATFEKYTIEKSIGKGGMGVVYLAKHLILETHFAIKVLLPEVAKNKKSVARFVREAKLASKIKHKNLVSITDIGHNQTYDVHYIIMEYLDGGSLKQLLKKRGKFPEIEVVNILIQLTSALEAAYKYNLVHRDIKPDNIMFSGGVVAKLTDLGIAKCNDNQDTMLTVEASIFGTPSYMSPEQAKDSHNVDVRSDIYSLGMVAYEMLTGQRVYSGNSMMEILSQVLMVDEAPDVRVIEESVTPELAMLIASMISKKINNRPKTPSDLLCRLEVLSNLSTSFHENLFETKEFVYDDNSVFVDTVDSRKDSKVEPKCNINTNTNIQSTCSNIEDTQIDSAISQHTVNATLSESIVNDNTVKEPSYYSISNQKERNDEVLSTWGSSGNAKNSKKPILIVSIVILSSLFLGVLGVGAIKYQDIIFKLENIIFLPIILFVILFVLILRSFIKS